MKPKGKQQSSSDEVFAGVESALRRARQRARETAARTGTPLVIYRDGKIEKVSATRGKKLKSK
jgi:hypothetical protein